MTPVYSLHQLSIIIIASDSPNENLMSLSIDKIVVSQSLQFAVYVSFKMTSTFFNIS